MQFSAPQQRHWIQADLRINLTLVAVSGIAIPWVESRAPGVAGRDPVLWATVVASCACVLECWFLAFRNRRLYSGALVPLALMSVALLSTWHDAPENSIWVIAALALVFMRFPLRIAIVAGPAALVACLLILAVHWSADGATFIRTLMAGVVFAAMLAFFALASRETTRRLRDTRAVLTSTLDAMAQGLVVVGRDGRVKVSNAKIAELLDLPREWRDDPQALERAVEFVEFMEPRGDHGPDAIGSPEEPGAAGGAAASATARRAGERPRSYTRRTSDGRYLAVDTLPMPSGDVVSTFTDVTSYELVNRQLEAVLKDYGELRQRELARSSELMVGALSRLATYRDHETGQHIARVVLYVRTLLEALARTERYAQELTAERIELIVTAAPMHDLGKIGVPDHILFSKGPHTPAEAVVMRTHARIGESTLLLAARGSGSRQSLFTVAARMAGGHHENWDGSGYPRGLAGHAIPLEARVMTLADVYDALTTARVYKGAWPHEAACAEIRRLCGVKFDPDVVAAFEQEHGEFLRIAERYADPVLHPPAA